MEEPIFKAGQKFSNRQGEQGAYTEAEIICIESVYSYPDDVFDRWQITLRITDHLGIMWRERDELLSQEEAKNKIDAIMRIRNEE